MWVDHTDRWQMIILALSDPCSTDHGNLPDTPNLVAKAETDDEPPDDLELNVPHGGCRRRHRDRHAEQSGVQGQVQMANTVSLQHTPCNPQGPLYIYPFEQEHILFRGFDGTWFRGNNAVWVDSRNAADIHCCHRWSDITDGTWSPLCNAGGIQFYIFRHKLGCTP